MNDPATMAKPRGKSTAKARTTWELVAAEKLSMISRNHDLALQHEMFKLDPEQVTYSETSANGEQRRGVEYHEIQTGFEDGSRFVLTFPSMGAFDLRVLHALIALSMGQLSRGSAKAHYSASDTSEAAVMAWRQLLPPRSLRQASAQEDKGNVQMMGLPGQVVVMRMSVRQLLRCIGQSNAGQEGSDKAFASLARLSAVTLSYFDPRGRRACSTRLVSDPVMLDERVQVCLNPALTRAIMRDSQTRVNFYLMDEMRRLRKQSAILLHSALSAFIPFGGTCEVSTHRLMTYLWRHQVTDDDADARKKRHHRKDTLAGALSELRHIGWNVSQSAQGERFVFERPRPVGAASPEQGIIDLSPKTLSRL